METTLPPKGEEVASGVEPPNESVRASIRLHFVSEFLSFLFLYALGRALICNLTKLSANGFVDHVFNIFFLISDASLSILY